MGFAVSHSIIAVSGVVVVAALGTSAVCRAVATFAALFADFVASGSASATDARVLSAGRASNVAVW
jgi:hypothetical protein